MTAKYETVIVCSVKDGEEAAKALVEKFKTLIENNAAADSVSVDEWGARKLAYPINYETDGYYTVFTYDAEPEFPAELERNCNITDGVIRSLTVKK
ncbi:MAG: 30S ribosomal protein S6 [Clostridia bacterium]|nr:30S ribosomal protein S6 [Clostridia bacterium]